MVYYVNDHLISEETLDKELSWYKNGSAEPYKRIIIGTCNVSKREEDGSFTTTSRTVCAHNCSDNNSAKTRISNIIPDGAGDKVRVSIRTSVSNKYDNDVFIVALPYDGLVLPVESADGLGIFRSMILRSDRMDIEHEDHKYRRALYLVVSPKFAPCADGWYPKECNLVVKTIRSNVGRKEEPTPDSYWVVTSHTVRFGTSGQFEITKEEEQVPYTSIVPENFRNTPLCKLVEPIRVGERRPDVVYEAKGKDDSRNTVGANITRKTESKPNYAAESYDEFENGHSMKHGKKNKKRRR